MFNWHKNKKENKISNPSTPAQNKERDGVTFHTMQDDLEPSKKNLSNIKPDENKTEKAPKAEIQYDDHEKKDGDNTEINSPFLSDAPPVPKPTAIPPKTAIVKDSITEDGTTEDNLTGDNIAKDKPAAVIKQKSAVLEKGQEIVLKIITLVLAIAAILLGVYYFWVTRNKNENLQTPGVIETQDPTEEIIYEDEPVEKYSSENPNYLPIDTESALPEDINQLLIRIASEIKELKKSGPFEFIVTDANNNPLSFSIFAYLAEISLSQNVLDSFDENFSIYFYRDEVNVKTGLAIDINNKETTALEIAKEETALPEKLQPFFLGASFPKNSQSFNTSQYKNFSIKYLNLSNDPDNVSVDYSFINSQLVIGFSKNTIRAIIDKMEQSDNLIIIDDGSDKENTKTDGSDADVGL